MHGRVTTGRPAGAHLQQRRVVRVADINVPGGNIGTLNLGMAAEAQIGIADHQHLLIHRTMRIMAQRAALAHGRMFKDKGARLVTMALLAAFILPGHGQPEPAGWF